MAGDSEVFLSFCLEVSHLQVSPTMLPVMTIVSCYSEAISPTQF